MAPQLQRPYFHFKNDAFEHTGELPDRVLGRIVELDGFFHLVREQNGTKQNAIDLACKSL